ncbi:hypothetical protein IWX78_001050 [Mycetocola sp. CAN_C7]|uniref:M23 family metallopeptidase n=1 Tax=Mycetocola sp. CAN_C7 TaxID=2787724 RepID=UPI0018CA22F6
MANFTEHPVVVDFPLRGDGWRAVTTPATRVPSHGTDLLGQRFAYDFLRVDARGSYHPGSPARTAVAGVRTRECYAWGAAIYSPVDAVVVSAVDGMPERTWIHPVREVARMAWNGFTFRPDRIPFILGNHVLLRFGTLFAGFAHLAPGTVDVATGQQVAAGELVGRIGHTGNSTSPHLHFQLMDSADLMAAHGIPCAFRAFEIQRDGAWVGADGIPGRRDLLRSTT